MQDPERRQNMPYRTLSNILVAVLVALIPLLPVGQRMEATTGLGLLHAIRGAQPAPPEAMVIALDAETVGWLHRNIDLLAGEGGALQHCLTPHAIEVLGRSRNVNVVARALYVCLLEDLAERNPNAIAIDINFNATGPDDARLAKVLAQSGNVLLLERIRSQDGLLRRLRPNALIGNAAAGIVMFQTDGGPDRVATGFLTRHPEFPDATAMPMAAAHRYGEATLPALPAFQPVWYYGPPKSITTLSLRDVLDPASPRQPPDDLSNTVVFLGASDPDNPDAYDHFRMPGLLDPAKIGGVEIAATAFLNLLHGHLPTRVGAAPSAGIVLLVALGLFTVASLLSGWRAIGAVLVAGAAYVGAAAAAFSTSYLWLPVAVPLLICVPVTMALTLLRRYSIARKLIRRLAPRQFADRMLAREDAARGQSMNEEATIMFIDLEGSTRLGELMGADRYNDLMNAYYDAAEIAIDRLGGMVVEFKGDGVLALFTRASAGGRHAALACQAARDISDAVALVPVEEPTGTFKRLKMRFGLHTGLVTTGAVGSRMRFNINAIGDPVNTASRIEQFGKAFTDHSEDVILMSGETRAAAGLDDTDADLIDRVQLRGHSRETDVWALRHPVASTVDKPSAVRLP